MVKRSADGRAGRAAPSQRLGIAHFFGRLAPSQSTSAVPNSSSAQRAAGGGGTPATDSSAPPDAAEASGAQAQAQAQPGPGRGPFASSGGSAAQGGGSNGASGAGGGQPASQAPHNPSDSQHSQQRLAPERPPPRRQRRAPLPRASAAAFEQQADDIVWCTSPTEHPRVPFARVDEARRGSGRNVTALLRKVTEKRRPPAGASAQAQHTPVRMPSMPFLTQGAPRDDAPQAPDRQQQQQQQQADGASGERAARRAWSPDERLRRGSAGGSGAGNDVDLLTEALAAVEDAATLRSGRKRSATKARRRSSGGAGRRSGRGRSSLGASGQPKQQRRKHVLDLLEELEGVMDRRQSLEGLAPGRQSAPASPRGTVQAHPDAQPRDGDHAGSDAGRHRALPSIPEHAEEAAATADRPGGPMATMSQITPTARQAHLHCAEGAADQCARPAGAQIRSQGPASGPPGGRLQAQPPSSAHRLPLQGGAHARNGPRSSPLGRLERVRGATPAKDAARNADPFEDSEDLLAQMLADIEAERLQKQQAAAVAAVQVQPQQQQQQQLPQQVPLARQQEGIAGAALTPAPFDSSSSVPERFMVIGMAVTGQVDLQLEVHHTTEEHKSHSARSERPDQPGRVGYTCIVRDAFAESAAMLEPGDCLHVLSPRVERGPEGQAVLIIDSAQGLLVTHPQVLLSGSKIGASFPCARRSVLQETVKYAEGDRTAALTGTMLHELFQGVIKEGVDAADLDMIALEATEIVMRNNEQLHAAGVSTADALGKMQEHYAPISDWAKTFLGPNKQHVPLDFNSRDENRFRLDRVVDIEESIHSARLGLKGAIDATLNGQVECAPSAMARSRAPQQPTTRDMVMPLEFKTGKPKDAEHKAQVMLYSLMLQDRYQTRDLPDGLLLYTKPAAMRGVRPARSDVVALMCRRNLLASKLRPGGALALPSMASSESNCKWCRSRPECMVAHAALENGGEQSSGVPGHYAQHAGHLVDDEKAFVRNWLRLIELEAVDVRPDKEGRSAASVAAEAITRAMPAWTMPPGPRSMAGLELVPPTESGNGRKGSDRMLGGSYVYSFRERQLAQPGAHASSDGAPASGGSGASEASNASAKARRCNLRDGDYVMVSAVPPHGPAVPMAAGLVKGGPTGVEITVALRRALVSAPGGPPREATEWRIDRQSNGPVGVPTMRGNVLRLAAPGGTPDGDTAQRLRELIIHGRPPRFADAKSFNVAMVAQQPWARGLNADQLNTVCHVMRTEEYALVQGMPGTGKSATIAACIRALAMAGKRVLLTCHTHSAVDNLLERLIDSDENAPVLRIGREEQVSDKVRPFTLASVSSDPAKLALKVTRARVVASTCLASAQDFFAHQRFDVCIVDEAGQLSLPIILGPLLLARRFVLVGDLNQLPPLVRSEAAREGGLGVSLFERLAKTQPQALVTLSLQYRMAEDIMYLSNSLVYDGRLRCGNESVASGMLDLQPLAPTSPARPEWVAAVADATKRVVFLDTSPLGAAAHERCKGDGNSGERFNPAEVSVVASSLSALLAAGLRMTDAVVITPYRAQEECIAQRLAVCSAETDGGSDGVSAAEVITVDRSQGRDCPCVLVSFVRSNPDRRAKGLLSDWRRVNVLLTRAQRKLVLVGDANTLRAEPLAERLLQLCTAKGQVVPVTRLEASAAAPAPAPGAQAQAL